MLQKKAVIPSALVRALLGVVSIGVLVLGGGAPAQAQGSGGPGITPPSSGWSAGPGASGANTITGALDQPSAANPIPVGGAFVVSGWLVDTTAQGWAGIDEVQVWNGLMGQGGTDLASATVALNRPDVAQALGYSSWAASGFAASVAASANTLPAGTATLNIYAHTPSGGWWYRPYSVPVGGAPAAAAAAASSGVTVASSPNGQPILAIEKPFAGEQVGVLTQNNTNTIYVKGYAFDPNGPPNSGSNIDDVEVWINGERDNGGTLLGTTTPGLPDPAALKAYGSQWENTGWSVPFMPTSFPDGYTVIYAYAHSSISKQWAVVKEGFNIVEGYGN